MIRGLDLSSYQPNIDFASLAELDVKFVFTKCAEGDNPHPDPTFRSNVDGCRRSGILVGPYFFVHPLPGLDPRAQAEHHFALSGGVGAAGIDLPPAVDIEWPTPDKWAKYGCSAAQIRDWMNVYLDQVRFLWARRPLVYTYPDFAHNVQFSPHVGRDLDLWIASYNVRSWPVDTDRPVVPQPWKAARFWQWSGGTVQLPSGTRVDADAFLGTRAELESYADLDVAIETVDPAASSTTEVT